MKFIPPLCMMLALSIPAYGQQPGTSPLPAMPGEPQPDPTGQRLQYLLKSVYELEQAGEVQGMTPKDVGTPWVLSAPVPAPRLAKSE